MLFNWVRSVLIGRDHRGHGSADWDAKYGTETGSSVDLEQLTIRHDSRRYGERYQASDPRVLRDSVKYIGLDPRGHHFVDLGCGKGRMLIIAAELGFKSCVGVEFADELARSARANAAASGMSTIGVIHGDAGSYAFKDEPFVLYMFNPFSRPIMERVRDNLLKLKTARYYVIYKNARERQLFDEMPTLRYRGSPPPHTGLWGTHVWVPRR